MSVAEQPRRGRTGSAERVAQQLREEIVEGVLTWGSPLREDALREQFGVSRNTLREALRVLGSAGLVEFDLYRGARVRPLGPADIADAYIVRRTLELRATEYGAIGDNLLDAMQDSITLTEMRAEAADWPAVTTAGLRFHQTLVSALGSKQLDQLFTNVVAQLRLLFSQASHTASFELPWHPRDQEIHELLSVGRRTEAARALSIYLDDSERAVLDMLRTSQRQDARGVRPDVKRS